MYQKLVGSNHRIFVRTTGNKVIGFLKMGEKNLFHRDAMGRVTEIYILCVLDFYVHESMQRGGHGKALFERMLAYEKEPPVKMAYDRPSYLLLRFLRKHYNLINYIPQNNKYVIFDEFFRNHHGKSKNAPKSSLNNNNRNI